MLPRFGQSTSLQMNAGTHAYLSHGWCIISSTPFLPIRTSGTATSLIITTTAESSPRNEVNALWSAIRSHVVRDLEVLLPMPNLHFTARSRSHLPARHRRIICAKRGVSRQHFKHNHSERPPINFFSISLFFKHLRRHIIRRSHR